MVDPKRCPFCQQQNFCDVNNAKACWCNKTKVPQALIKLVPLGLKNKACICKSCVEAFTKDPENFKKRYL